jgi:hypothetical protein
MGLIARRRTRRSGGGRARTCAGPADQIKKGPRTVILGRRYEVGRRALTGAGGGSRSLQDGLRHRLQSTGRWGKRGVRPVNEVSKDCSNRSNHGGHQITGPRAST